MTPTSPPSLQLLVSPPLERTSPWTSRIPSSYEIGNVPPIGGHLALERLSYNAITATKKGVYVRVVIKEAAVPFDYC
jgi:acid phosphatase